MPARKTAAKGAAKAPAKTPAKAAAKSPAKAPAKPAAKAPAKGARKTASKPALTFDEIAKAAYLIHLRRVASGQPDDPTADWLEAERQLKGG